jgi:hypothetical protein
MSNAQRRSKKKGLGKIRAKHYSQPWPKKSKIKVGIGTNKKAPTGLLLRELVVFDFSIIQVAQRY